MTQNIKKSKRVYVLLGMFDPIIINMDDTIIGGHQRANVLKDLGYEDVDVVVVDIDKDQEKALNVALNKISGEWDLPALKELIVELEEAEFDVSLTGFEAEELDDIFTQVDRDQAPTEVEEDEFDVGQALSEITEPITKKGDLWLIGNHVLLCGDSTNSDDVKTLMNGNKAKFVFTDPPWNVNYGAVEPDHPKYKERTIMNDFMGTEDFKQFMFNAFKNMNMASEEGCMTYVVMSAQEWGNCMLTLAQNEYHWSSTIIWNKSHLVISRKDYHTKYEPLWYGWKEGAARLVPMEDRKQSDVWDIDRPTKSEEHPTMKPLELVARAMTNSSYPHDIVLDLFGGSGSTLLVAEQLDRQCFMMELDPKYCDVIINRYIQFTDNSHDVKVIRDGKEHSYHSLTEFI